MKPKYRIKPMKFTKTPFRVTHDLVIGAPLFGQKFEIRREKDPATRKKGKWTATVIGGVSKQFRCLPSAKRWLEVRRDLMIKKYLIRLA